MEKNTTPNNEIHITIYRVTHGAAESMREEPSSGSPRLVLNTTTTTKLSPYTLVRRIILDSHAKQLARRRLQLKCAPAPTTFLIW